MLYMWQAFSLFFPLLETEPAQHADEGIVDVLNLSLSDTYDIKLAGVIVQLS